MADVRWSNNVSFPIIANPDDNDLIVGLYTDNGGKNGKITAISWVNSYLNQKITVDLSTNVTGTLPTDNGGTGQTAYTDGQLLIGKTDGTLAANTLTAGSGITINNTDGAIEIVNNAGDPVLQTTYDNSPDGDIALAVGKDFMLSSTVAGFRPSEMTNAQFQLIPSPLNGLQAWSNTDDRPIYNRGTAVTPDYVLGAYLSDIASALDNLAYGSMNFQGNVTETVISTINTYVKVNATYVSGSLLGFSQGGGTLTYSDTETRVVQVICSLSSKLSTTTANLEYAVFINGVLFPQSQSTSFSGSVTDSPIATTIIAQPELSTGDTIDIFVRNNSGTENIIVESLNCTVGTIGASGTGSSSTLEEAYTAGDGTMTMTADKPLSFLSNDNAIIPSIETEQLQVPANQQQLGNFSMLGKNSSGTEINYSELYTESRVATAANESSRIDWFAYAQGLRRLIFRFSGESTAAGIGGLLTLNCPSNFGNHNVIGIADLSQEVGTTTLNNSSTAVGNFQVNVPGSNGFNVNYTDPNIGVTCDLPMSLEGKDLNNVGNLDSGNTGVAINSFSGGSGQVITDQSFMRVGNQVSVNVVYNFTASANSQLMTMTLPFTSNNFSGLNNARGQGTVTRIPTLNAWNGQVTLVLSVSGTQTIQINTSTSDSSSLFKASVEFTYDIV